MSELFLHHLYCMLLILTYLTLPFSSNSLCNFNGNIQFVHIMIRICKSRNIIHLLLQENHTNSIHKNCIQLELQQVPFPLPNNLHFPCFKLCFCFSIDCICSKQQVHCLSIHSLTEDICCNILLFSLKTFIFSTVRSSSLFSIASFTKLLYFIKISSTLLSRNFHSLFLFIVTPSLLSISLISVLFVICKADICFLGEISYA